MGRIVLNVSLELTPAQAEAAERAAAEALAEGRCTFALPVALPPRIADPAGFLCDLREARERHCGRCR